MFRDYIEFSLNGKPHQVRGEAIFQPLSSYLRYSRGLTGTKVVCAEGDCGACSVMARRPDGEFCAMNSCIAMTFLLDGMDLVTVEGLAKDGKLNEIQNSMVRNFGGQCGFCTPGFVMAITDLFEHKPQVNEKQARNALTGNLCRCTGYQPILNAVLDVNVRQHQRLGERFTTGVAKNKTPVLIEFGEQTFYAPADLTSACRYRVENPGAVIFSGSTDLGVRYNKGHIRPRHFMSLNLIDGLYDLGVAGDEISVGARVNLAQLSRFLKPHIPEFAQFLNIFASPQIKNSATLIGNLANASPIADTTPLLMSLDAEVDVRGVGGARTIALSDFYLGYKKLALKVDEIIERVRFKKLRKSEIFGNYKISQRRDLDISCVNASFRLELESGTVRGARISLGGVGPTTLRLITLEKLLLGEKISRELIERVKGEMAVAIRPISDARGSAEFRVKVVQNLFEKFAQEKLGL